MKRIINQGAMSQDNGTEMTKLVTMTAGIQKNAWVIRAETLTTGSRIAN